MTNLIHALNFDMLSSEIKQTSVFNSLVFGLSRSLAWVNGIQEIYINFNTIVSNSNNIFNYDIIFKIFSHVISIYVPQPRKLVFSLQLRVKQCCIFRYRGIQCRNWTAHVHYSLTAERNLFLILLLLTYSSYSGTQSISYSSSSHFFFVKR